eukprot:1158131-Pelagomonas_calceolata.AAC.5
MDVSANSSICTCKIQIPFAQQLYLPHALLILKRKRETLSGGPHKTDLRHEWTNGDASRARQWSSLNPVYVGKHRFHARRQAEIHAPQLVRICRCVAGSYVRDEALDGDKGMLLANEGSWLVRWTVVHKVYGRKGKQQVVMEQGQHRVA